METVVQFIRHESKEWNAEVKYIVLEHVVIQEEVNVSDMVLSFGEHIPEIALIRIHVKFLSLGTFTK